MTKKQLKQRIAEVFADKNITSKSQYIRDLIEKEVSQDMCMVDKDNLVSTKDIIYQMNKRQEQGYKSFEMFRTSINDMVKQINSMKFVVIILSLLNVIVLVFK